MGVVIAIDFGTTHSGFAFGSTRDGDVRSWKTWPDAPSPADKTVTDLLLAPNGTVAAWGHSVRTKLAELTRRGQVAQYIRAPLGLKMLLREGTPSPEGPTYIHAGKTYRVLDWVVLYLRCLKEQALQAVQSSAEGRLRETDIRWCLTVPGIWRDQEKEWMRLAAQQAGLIGSGPEEARRLSLVLEPEAAMLYIQNKVAGQKAGGFRPGTRFMAVDVGGGTIDIVVQEVMEGGLLREVVQGTGAAVGSKIIDDAFRKLLDRRLTPQIMETFRDTDPLGYLELMNAWERTKCTPNVDSPVHLVEFPPQLLALLKRRAPEVLAQLAERQEGVADKLQITREALREMFRPVLVAVSKHVALQFARLGDQKCDYLFMVGGFASSPLLQERLRRDVGAQVRKIVVLPDPSKAVLHGAVLFGLDPAHIVERRMRLTYGCEMYARFEEGIDPEAKRIWSNEDNGYFCTQRFDVFVRASESVVAGQPFTRVYAPMSPSQTVATFRLFTSPDPKVRYTDQAKVRHIGEVTLEMPGTASGGDGKVELSLDFGQSEIRVEAYDRSSGRRAQTTLKYTS